MEFVGGESCEEWSSAVLRLERRVAKKSKNSKRNLDSIRFDLKRSAFVTGFVGVKAARSGAAKC